MKSVSYNTKHLSKFFFNAEYLIFLNQILLMFSYYIKVVFYVCVVYKKYSILKRFTSNI